jgi:RNA polymerase sigma factor (sigma-70 family)
MNGDAAEMAERRQNIIQAVRDYGARLFGFIRTRVPREEDAQDILQDVWLQLSSQPELEAIESVSGWLFRVARNRITDRYRKKRTDALEDLRITDAEEEAEWSWYELLAAENEDPESEQLRALFRETLAEALTELPENQRSVFIRNELEDMTLQAIADQDGANLKTIISRKRYAVQHLRRRLADLYTEFLND